MWAAFRIPTTAGPEWIQIGTESGFLPQPAVIPHQPVTWNTRPDHVQHGQRAGSQPAARHRRARRRDRRLLQVRRARRSSCTTTRRRRSRRSTRAPTTSPVAGHDRYRRHQVDQGRLRPQHPHASCRSRSRPPRRRRRSTSTQLKAAFSSTNETEGVFERGQNPIIVPDARYNAAYNQTFTGRCRTSASTRTSHDLQDAATATVVTMPLGPKAIQDERARRSTRTTAA